MRQDYADKQIWIIGASSGIGESLARELAARGATLILSARSEDKLDALKEDLKGVHHTVPIDIADPDTTVHAAGYIATRIGRIDSVIVLAAIYQPMRLDALDMEMVHNMIDVNLKGYFHVAHAILPILKKQGGGQLALCGSVAGYRGLPKGQPYSATKAGILNLAESLRLETRQDNIDIRLISPGFVRTPMTDKNDFEMPAMIEPETAAQAIADGLLSGRFEIHFPKRFTLVIKLLRLMPNALYFWLARKML